MTDRRTGDDCFVVTKEPGWAIEGCAKHVQCIAKVHDLFYRLTTCHKFRTIGSGFNLFLSFGKPVNRSLVEEVQDTGGRMTGNDIMH